ncbi:MAG TPA: heparan-alpha-glucosaminide N-acetyltransferase domain-containing protein [Puia sp.]|nr:heparan-alpha-glucosaminide N-acetyltransferase domain-containing protein [Puia sp.]
MKRIQSIDIARGLVMVIMAIDHARDLLHVDSLTQSPTDLATTTPILFFTRWITHLCAPSFVFLSGISAWLSVNRQRTAPGKPGTPGTAVTPGTPGSSIRRHFLIRGIWLIILEFTIVNFALWWDIHFRIIMFQVIATIGFGFIALAFLYRLPPKILAGIGLLIIFGHDLLSQVMLPVDQTARILLSLFFSNGLFPITPNFSLLIAYPVIPWLGILLTGFAAGRIFEMPAEKRKKLLLRAGFAAIGLFLLLRLGNFYGDPAPWTVQRNRIYSVLSFFNVSKYPPSLLYTLIMLGLLFLFLAFLEGKGGVVGRILGVFGKVPLFYYLVHWYVLRSAMFIMVFAEGFHIRDLLFTPFQFGRPAKGSGLPLAGVYAVWLIIVVLLYPLCRWYGRYRAAHPEKTLLRYL